MGWKVSGNITKNSLLYFLQSVYPPGNPKIWFRKLAHRKIFRERNAEKYAGFINNTERQEVSTMDLGKAMV